MKLRSAIIVSILVILTVFGFNPIASIQAAQASPSTSYTSHSEPVSIEENYTADRYEQDSREKGHIFAQKGRELGKIMRKQGQAIGQYYKEQGRNNKKNPQYQSLTLEEIYQNWGRGLYW